MRKLLCILFLLALTHVVRAQPGIKGRISDTLQQTSLQHAVIALIQKSDSTLVSYTRSGAGGIFKLSAAPGNYYLLVTYPDYVDFIDEVTIDKSFLELGDLPLIQRTALLENLVVRQNMAIRIKGDTIEYKADSFRVSEGASVKDLLRQLPGMQIDKNGQVIAHGQKVEKVLVDGEEFFTDDPAVVIENLRADAIDKVQEYDKKSDQAEFTGVDDGSRSKTLNLVLKEDRKKGMMGKLVLGGGSTERYSEEAMLNFFKGKRKFSVYGIASNTGRMGLDWGERSVYGEGDDFEDAEIGAGFIMFNNNEDSDFSDWQSQYYSEGIPRTIRAGVHASDKWNSDKNSANINYSLKNVHVNGFGGSLSKYILPDSAYYSKENHTSNNAQDQHLVSGKFDLKLDSLSSVRFRFNGKLKTASSGSESETMSLNKDQVLINRNQRDISNQDHDKVFLGSVLWRQKFTKKGRTLSLNISYKNSEKKNDGYLLSITNFYDPFGNINELDTIDQYKRNLNFVTDVNSRLVFTEPIGKKGLIEMNYTFRSMESTSDRKSFDKLNGKYQDLNAVFSNRYGLNFTANSAGLKYQYNGKKIVANLGANLGISDYRQRDSSGNEVRHFRYTNLFPVSRINWKISTQRNLQLQYSGTPQPPSINQIQPVFENTNPLFIIEGNPFLKQEFNHNMSLFYMDYKVLSGRSIWFNAYYNPRQNAIVSDRVVDKGITRQRYTNARGNSVFGIYGYYGYRLKNDIDLGLNTEVNSSRNVDFVNGIKNRAFNNSYGLGLSAGKYKQDKFNLRMELNVKYNDMQSNISSASNNFWNQEHTMNVFFFITKRLEIGSNAVFYLREKTDAFTTDNNFTVWDGFISYRVFKKRNGVFRFEVKDILKQRRGFARTLTSTYVHERYYNMLGRYGMLSFTWNFTKSPASTN